MSLWTNVSGVIYVEAMRKQDVTDVVNYCKDKITGSEGPCHINIVHLDIRTGSYSYKYKGEIKIKQIYDRYALVFTGFLDNRALDTTNAEVYNVIKYINDKLFITDIILNVYSGGFSKVYTLEDIFNIPITNKE